jgi:RNA polymerase sigma-70 factor (ECF subfamily)
MQSTSLTLLERLRQPACRQEDWARFVRLYTPLLYYWARRAGLQESDAADLVQEVFTLLLEKLPSFRKDGTGSFRSWLRTVTLNKWRERNRRAALPVTEADHTLAGLATPDPLEEHWEADYRQHLVGEALRLMRAEFHPTTWQACWEHVVSGKSAAEVANELGLTPGAVRAAKFRVLSRLRQELTGLLD